MQILRYITLIIVGMLSFLTAAQGEVYMHPNRGQWHENILHKVELAQGDFLIEKDGFTYNLHNASEKFHANHEEEEHSHDHDLETFERHVIKTKFVNSNWAGEYFESGKSSAYRNYFLGKDSTKWASGVYSYSQLVMKNYYPGVDLELSTKNENLKYSFIVQPNQNIDNIKFSIDGSEELFIDKDGNLHVPTRFGDIIESAPKAWTNGESGNTMVECKFSLSDGVVRFVFPDGYDKTKTLVIDPDLTFSTFTGSTSDNWGFTAAPDQNGNLYGGGIVMGAGYPLTAGAYDGSYAGGEGVLSIDIGITKFNSAGTALIYSTYLGGSGNETPHSIVVDDLNQLYVLGATSSVNFPMLANSFQSIFAGGVSTTQNGLTFSGSDIFVTKFNAGGTNILGSTYIGGTGNDGLNTSVLNYNYGDQFRGEIIVDANNNVYLASATTSTNFPVINGQDNSLGGNQDAVVVKMNSNLSAIIWSTYYGGAGFETGNALQISSTGNVYLTGGTTSAGLNMVSGNNLAFAGGLSDGYLVQMNGTTSNVISGTYINTPSYDQSYFVQLDLDDFVYVFGQSDGNMTISAGKYGTANSGQFIRKYSEDLSSLEWTTRIGAGTGNIEISPTAFLVSDCYDIYIAGWGGQVNQSSQASNSSSNGFQTTPDAYQSTTNGNNFYIAVIGDDATTLKYATYIGGTTGSSNHVDGGTSRFDKTGRIYHAVCGSCGAPNNGFTTTPGVWSPTAQSSNCNLAAFKFDLSLIESVVSTPTPFVCIPDPVNFINNSSNGNGFFWDFGDNTTSTDVNPSHFYSAPGDYNVTLVVSDTNGCYEPDTSEFIVSIGIFEGAIVQPPTPVCPGIPYQLEASGGSTYAWTPANLLDDPTSATPMATVTQGTQFTVIVSDSCGSDTLTAFLDVYGATASTIGDTSICVGDSIEVWASGGGTYSWSPATGLAYTDQETTMCSPPNTTLYTVDITTPEGCELTREFQVEVFFNEPQPVIPDTVNTCENTPVTISVSGATDYTWFPDYEITSTIGATNTISTNVDTTYYVDFTNACGTVRDSVIIDVITVEAFAGNDTIVCPGELAFVYAEGGVSYSWSPSASVTYPSESITSVQPNNPTNYVVTVTDENGCSNVANVFIDHFPQPFVNASPDYYGFEGDEVQMNAQGSSPVGTYSWSPTEYISCVNCTDPIATAPQTITYTVEFVDGNGCEAKDQVNIFFNGIIWVPNTFTPNGDGFNDQFYVLGGNIEYFHIDIFNRWGELIYTSEDMEEVWDGTYNDLESPDGTYVWKLVWEDKSGERNLLTGHVNLLR